MVDTNTLEFLAGLEAVWLACGITEAVQMEMQQQGATKLDKADNSPVTIADFASQAIICRRIGESLPHDSIVAEEDNEALRQPANQTALEQVVFYVNSVRGEATTEQVCEWIDKGNAPAHGRYWVLDPIDGTKGFLRGEQYAIALALIEDGEPRWAFLGCPNYEGTDGTTGRIFVAQKGKGAYEYRTNRAFVRLVQASTTTAFPTARMAESVEVLHKHHGLAHRVKVALGMRLDSLLMDSQAKYAAVASGDAEIYLRAPNPRTPDYRENIWDHAAGWLLVQEAGGIVTDIHGNPLDWEHGRKLEHNIGIVAAPPALHSTVIATLQQELKALT
jgi:3'(2'), 5'-bisphosphate nucleotidase